MWSYYLSRGRLEFLSEQRGVYVAHVYPARLDSVKAFYDWEQPVWKIQPAFDEALRSLAVLRDSGRIWVPTVREYLDYVSARDALVYGFTPSGEAMISNVSGTPIKGLSMCVRNADVAVPGKEIGKRKEGAYTVFWFDLNPQETVTIKVEMVP